MLLSLNSFLASLKASYKSSQDCMLRLNYYSVFTVSQPFRDFLLVFDFSLSLFIFYKHLCKLFKLIYGFTLSDTKTLLFKYYMAFLITWLSYKNLYILSFSFLDKISGSFCLHAYYKLPSDKLSKIFYKGFIRSLESIGI